MTTGATGQLGLALPVQGELSGTWGNTVNNAITEYTNIAIAATLTLTNDGAVTLANTTGTDLATNITSSLTGAGTVTAQFAIVRVTGTLTTAKVVTAPSYSKTYTVVNAATGGIVTFKASGQTGVSIAVGESAFVYFNGTDYVKVSGTSAVSSFTAGSTGFTPSTATTGAVTLAGTLATTNGGTGLTSFTSGGVVYASSSSALATGSALTFDGTNFGLTLSQDAATKATLTNSNGGTSAVARYEASNGSNTTEFGIRGTAQTTNGVLVPQVGYAYSPSAAGLALVAAAGPVMFAASGTTEGMRLTSTGLGIGTSSPTGRLDLLSTYVSDTTVQARIRDNTGYALNFTGTASGFKALQVQDSTGAAGYTSLLLNPLGGNVGIGTSSPTTKLEVNGNVLKIYDQSTSNANLVVRNSTTGNAAGFNLQQDGVNTLFYNSSNGYMAFATNATERARISAAGGFSVGTTADPGAGAIYATGNITAYYSDARLKTVSGKIENALDKVGKLSGVYYTNNDTAKSFGYDSDEVQVGVLAQEVEAVLPQIVKAAPFDLDQDGNSKSGENYKTVQYDKLVPLLIEAINELQAKVKALEAK